MVGFHSEINPDDYIVFIPMYIPGEISLAVSRLILTLTMMFVSGISNIPAHLHCLVVNWESPYLDP